MDGQISVIYISVLDGLTEFPCGLLAVRNKEVCLIISALCRMSLVVRREWNWIEKNAEGKQNPCLVLAIKCGINYSKNKMSYNKMPYNNIQYNTITVKKAVLFDSVLFENDSNKK